MLKKYRETHLLADWVGFTLIWDFPRLVGRYCSYLLPKQAGGTPQILVDKTSPMSGRLRVYVKIQKIQPLYVSVSYLRYI